MCLGGGAFFYCNKWHVYLFTVIVWGEKRDYTNNMKKLLELVKKFSNNPFKKKHATELEKKVVKSGAY